MQVWAAREKEQFSRRERKWSINHCQSPWAGKKCQVCSHLHERGEVQERAGTGEAAVPKPLGAGSRFSEIQVKWGEVGGHGKEIPYEK